MRNYPYFGCKWVLELRHQEQLLPVSNRFLLYILSGLGKEPLRFTVLDCYWELWFYILRTTSRGWDLKINLVTVK